jgi:hypothetical protein
MYEIENSTSIPRRFKDLIDLSIGVKNQNNIIRNRLRVVDSLLCITALVTITISVIDVIFFFI